MADLHFLSLRLTEKYSDIAVCLECTSSFFFLVKISLIKYINNSIDNSHKAQFPPLHLIFPSSTVLCRTCAISNYYY